MPDAVWTALIWTEAGLIPIMVFGSMSVGLVTAVEMGLGALGLVSHWGLVCLHALLFLGSAACFAFLAQLGVRRLFTAGRISNRPSEVVLGVVLNGLAAFSNGEGWRFDARRTRDARWTLTRQGSKPLQIAYDEKAPPDKRLVLRQGDDLLAELGCDVDPEEHEERLRGLGREFMKCLARLYPGPALDGARVHWRRLDAEVEVPVAEFPPFSLSPATALVKALPEPQLDALHHGARRIRWAFCLLPLAALGWFVATTLVFGLVAPDFAETSTARVIGAGLWPLSLVFCVKLLSFKYDVPSEAQRACVGFAEAPLEWSGRSLAQGSSEVDLDGAFSVQFAHAEGCVTITLAGAAGGERARLSFRVLAEPSSALEQMPHLVSSAPLFAAPDVEQRLWPLILSRAQVHGLRVPWTISSVGSH